MELLITRETLIKALQNRVGRKGMNREDIERLSDYILSFFGYENEIIDNVLTAKDRDVFYMLEEEGFLGTREEETHLKKGKPWRIHYWVLRRDNIEKFSREQNDIKNEESEYSIYDVIFKSNDWNRR